MSWLIGVFAASTRLRAHAVLHALGLLVVMVALLTTAADAAQAAGSVRVEVWVGQHAESTGDIRVGARPADGSWPAPELIRLPLDDGVSSSGRYRYGDVAIGVEWRVGTAPVTVEVRVWQHVEDEGNLHISARGSLGSWRTLGTVPLALADAAGSSAYRAGGVTVDAPLPEGEMGAPLRYRFDPAGKATGPGSYAFLTAPVATEITTYEGLREDAASVVIEVDESGAATYTFYTAPRASVITTYEGLRRDAATLRLNATAADGASSEGLFGTVEAGHLIEWFHARGCFVRYRVTSVAEADAVAPVREFGVRPETYVFQGCQSGSLPADETIVAFSAAEELPLEHLGGTRLSSSYAVVHGVWELYSSGSVAHETDVLIPEADPPHIPAEFANTGTITSLTDARKFPYWREPTLPSGWRFYRLYIGGGGDLPPGYEAFFSDQAGDHALEIRGEHVVGSPRPWEATWLTNVGKRIVREPRIVANRPAVVMYSPDGPQQSTTLGARVDIYDADTETVYIVIGSARMGGGPAGLERVLAIARSLFTARGASNQADAARQGIRDSESLNVPIPVTTYEGLRTEADTPRIHVTNGSGVSCASFYGTVEVGDTFEWREAGDCWVRYS